MLPRRPVWKINQSGRTALSLNITNTRIGIAKKTQPIKLDRIFARPTSTSLSTERKAPQKRSKLFFLSLISRLCSLDKSEIFPLISPCCKPKLYLCAHSEQSGSLFFDHSSIFVSFLHHAHWNINFNLRLFLL